MSSRIVSIDYGKARVGMAMSDEKKIIASPLATIQTEKKCQQTVERVCQKINELLKQGYQIETVVVGLPLLLSGKMSAMSDEVNEFAAKLAQFLSIPVKTWDERLTSVQADRSLREAKMNRKKRAKSVDSVSAVLILQSYLDSQKNSFFSEEF